jgi:hypothetical protein
MASFDFMLIFEFKAIAVCSICLPAGLPRLGSGVVIFSLFFYVVFWTRAPTNDAYLAGSQAVMLLFRWLDLVAIHKPERDFWKTPKGKDGGEAAIVHAPLSAWGKLQWFFGLWITQRYVLCLINQDCNAEVSSSGLGWNIEPENLPSIPKDYPKGLFLKQTLIRTLRLYLILDIGSNILKYAFAGHDEPFFSFPLPLQLLIVWAAGFSGYIGIEWAYSMGALLTVAPGIYAPSDWSPISGNFKRDAWSIRKLWGSCWHQMLRRQGTEAGRIVKEMFGFKKGTFMSRYSQLWMAFILSTAVHQASAMTGAYEDGGWNQAIYFMVQPVGIMFEDGVIGLGKMMGLKESGKFTISLVRSELMTQFGPNLSDGFGSSAGSRSGSGTSLPFGHGRERQNWSFRVSWTIC